tara:strand:- start:1502 stop:1846 length:345 start_codon:yes stop_codon:yes gene_type:complete
MAGIVVIGAHNAEVGVRKLKAAGCDVTRVNPEKGWQLKDPEIRAADVVVLDREYVVPDTLRRIKSIGTPHVLVGATDGVTWSTCLRPIVAILRGDRRAVGDAVGDADGDVVDHS